MYACVRVHVCCVFKFVCSCVHVCIHVCIYVYVKCVYDVYVCVYIYCVYI